MILKNETSFKATALACSLLVWLAGAVTASALEGKVLGGGKPLANSTVTLWAAGEAHRNNWVRPVLAPMVALQSIQRLRLAVTRSI